MKAISLAFFLILNITLIAQTTRTVTSLSDSGPGTLRDKITNSNSGDTIAFSPSLLANGGDTIKLSSAISFTHGLFINGLMNGADTLYISGENSTKIFTVDLTGDFTRILVLRDLTFVDAWNQGSGGAISVRNADSLAVINSVFRNNETMGNHAGGALFADAVLSILVRESVFESNRSVMIIAGGGGAIRFNACTSVAIENSRFADCSSDAYGGGLYFDNLDHYSISDCAFYSNDAQVFGGAIESVKSAGVINRTTFVNNHSTGKGGAISLHNEDTVTIVDCLFRLNDAAHEGGALYVTNMGVAAIHNSSFVGNESSVGSAAVCNRYGSQMEISTSSFSGNVNGAFIQSGNYGAVFCVSSIKNTTFAGGGNPSGQALFISESGTCEISGSIFTRSLTVLNNSCTSLGYNILADAPAFALPSDMINVDSMSLALGPMAMNGGYTPTMVPGLTSVAIDMGDSTDFSAAQNGPVFGRRDIGAAERANISFDTACGPVVWWGSVYTAPGVYADTVVNANSIDSIGVLVLAGLEKGVVSMNGELYVSGNESGTTYQWVDCDNGYAVISGETDSSFIPSMNGSYAVVLDNGICTDTSACILYEEFGVEEGMSTTDGITFYPNPTTGTIYLRSDGELPAHLEVFDLTGRRVTGIPVQSASLQLPAMSPGTYLLKWTGEDGSVQVDRVVIR